ncbi:hypothetical protein REPUB_Repub11eG0031800 [Reevesia pubescens]
MAHFNKTAILIIAIILVCHAPSFGARKVLSNEKVNGPVLEQSIIVIANPKVLGSPASPAKNGHAMVVNDMHITKQNALPDQSVPSPGAGN